jgi:hypothetical protein
MCSFSNAGNDEARHELGGRRGKSVKAQLAGEVGTVGAERRRGERDWVIWTGPANSHRGRRLPSCRTQGRTDDSIRSRAATILTFSLAWKGASRNGLQTFSKASIGSTGLQQRIAKRQKSPFRSAMFPPAKRRAWSSPAPPSYSRSTEELRLRTRSNAPQVETAPSPQGRPRVEQAFRGPPAKVAISVASSACAAGLRIGVESACIGARCREPRTPGHRTSAADRALRKRL